MMLALVLGLAPSSAHAAAMRATTSRIGTEKIIDASVSQLQLQQSTMEDGNALLQPLPPSTEMASATRKRKADGKESTSFMGSVSL